MRGGKPRGRKSRRRHCGKAIEACRPVARSRHQRPRGSRARQPCKEKTWRTWVRARGQAQRAKEQKPWRTEGRSQPAGTRASARIADTGVCRLRIACRSIEALRGPRCSRPDLTIRIRRAANRRGDKARPQLSLAAGAAGNGDLRTASSPGPVSGRFGSARRAHAVAPTATAPKSANARCHSSAGTPELGKTKSRMITRHGGGHSKHEGDGGADQWRAERRDRNLSCREGDGSCDQCDKESAELARTALIGR